MREVISKQVSSSAVFLWWLSSVVVFIYFFLLQIHWHQSYALQLVKWFEMETGTYLFNYLNKLIKFTINEVWIIIQTELTNLYEFKNLC